MKEGWEYKKFEAALEKVKYTKKLQTNEFLPKGRVPVISQEEEFISGYWDKVEDAFIVKTPVVVFGDHSRVLKYIDFDFVLGADGVKILMPINSLNAKFLYHYLKWYNIPNMGYSRHYKFLKEINLPIPPILEQQRIVEQLDLLSGIIEKQKAQLAELDKLAQSIFYDMFGDPVTNEKGWETKELSSVAPQKGFEGKVPDKGGKYWILNLDMIKAQTGDIIEKCYFTKDEIGNSTIIFDNKNVLYSKLRPYLNKVVIPQSAGFGTSELIPLKPLENVMNRCFLAYLLRSKQFVSFINIKVQGAKMPRVSMNVLREFPTILPPLSLQQEFAEKIEAIEAMKAKVRQSLKEAETLFNSRMDYYFQ